LPAKRQLSPQIDVAGFHFILALPPVPQDIHQPTCSFDKGKHKLEFLFLFVNDETTAQQ
jgi:hypothetical protein